LQDPYAAIDISEPLMPKKASKTAGGNFYSKKATTGSSDPYSYDNDIGAKDVQYSEQ